MAELRPCIVHIPEQKETYRDIRGELRENIFKKGEGA